jgi:RNA polymerase sigma-70 factor (ECF subfamily)
VGVAREAFLTPSEAPPAEAGRDAEQFERIVRRYGRQVFNLAYRMTGNDADAQDLTQEAFLRVFRAMGRIRPGVPLDGWLYRIVTNLFIDTARRRRRVRVESLDQPAATPSGGHVERDVPDPSGDPESLVVDPVLDAHVQQALVELSPELRAVVLLSDVEGFAYEEIAHILGLPLGTVKSRLHRARRFLRERLSPVLRGETP